LSTYILVDDEPDVEHLFRQQFRRDMRSGRFIMEFASSAPEALERAKTIADPLLILSDINMPGMSGPEMLPKVKAAECARDHDYSIRKRVTKEEGGRTWGGRNGAVAARRHEGCTGRLKGTKSRE